MSLVIVQQRYSRARYLLTGSHLQQTPDVQVKLDGNNVTFSEKVTDWWDKKAVILRLK